MFTDHFQAGVLDVVCSLILDVAAARPAAKHLLEMMQHQTSLGLAAPQIGITSSIIIINAPRLNVGKSEIIMLNPSVIVSSDERCSQSETCTSYPGFNVSIVRPRSVFVEYIDLEGKVHREEYNDLVARVVQHEIDHLDGMTILDRAPRQIRRKYLASRR